MATSAAKLKAKGSQTGTEQQRLEGGHLPQVMEQPGLLVQDSEDSNSPDEYGERGAPGHDPNYHDDPSQPLYTPPSTLENLSSPTSFAPSQASWNSYTLTRPRNNSGSGGALSNHDGPVPPSPRLQRPTAPTRTPSNTYNPQRKPPQFIAIQENRTRSKSNPRRGRNPEREYQAQEKAYIQQLRQDRNGYFGNDSYTPSLAYSSLSEDEDESPASDAQFDNDPYDQDTQLFYNTDDIQPSLEELQVPGNRERLEWHSMLASVLKGDVVKQEKQRLIGTGEQRGDKALNAEIWVGVRARVCGRSLAAQKRIIDEGRAGVGTEVESIINFKIKGETEVGKPAMKQVQDVVEKIEKCEGFYPTRAAFESEVSRAGSDDFKDCCHAVVAWHNTTVLINTQLGILQGWVGNEGLDFSKVRARSPSGSGLTDEFSFIDRILKEDGLKSLQGKNSLLAGVAQVIQKAKISLIENAQAFAQRHLPPYIEELLTLINFPSRLIQEVIRMRLRYAKRMKDPMQQNPMMVEQIIQQFQILLKLAVEIKSEYLIISQPEPGWDLPPCIDENFDATALDALKFYFKLLNSRLVLSKNTFKEAEILEQEWEFCNDIGRHLDTGDVEVAEQFSGLTAKALQRLTSHFGRELERRPEEDGQGIEKRYKQILDSVRVRQRKLFRFSKLLSERFENATEYSINLQRGQLRELYDALVTSGHFMIYIPDMEADNIVFIGSPSLAKRPKTIQSILGTSFRPQDTIEDPTNPYILTIRPEEPLHWDGNRVEVDLRAFPTDIRPGRLRLVADGSQQKLLNARTNFEELTGVHLDVLTEMRANLSRVNAELGRIKKTAYKLSNTIMESVEIIRTQTRGFGNQELIQTCFAFATEFGKRSVGFMDANRRMMNNLKLTRLALDWVSFICDDCIASDRKTFKWAVIALEFAMVMTRGPNILSITDDEFTRLRVKVSGCMSLLIAHFDIMGARSTIAAQAEKQRMEASYGQFRKMDISKMKDDREASEFVRKQWCEKLYELDELRKYKESERRTLGRVLEDSNEADRSLTYLSSSATNVNLRWQQGQFVGGGTFGSVYAAVNLDSGQLMAVKEIRLQDPQLIPTIAQQIRDEMGVLEVLDHPNIVAYYGIEVHRDKVCIFMEFCSGGSLANLLEHGRIEDETVIQVYALQMLEGLAHLHSSGIVHRDIKPESE